MRFAVYALAAGLATLAAVPARAGTILYATAASQDRVDGFCVRNDGSLAPTPTVKRCVGTPSRCTPGGGTDDNAPHHAEPRRLVVANGVLYVAELDRVEAFSIGPHGGLEKLGSTEVLTKGKDGNNMEAVDITTSPDGSLLYVAERGPDQVVAYSIPLASDAQLTSCIQGESNADYLALTVHAGNLYVSGAGQVRGVN